MMPCNKVQFQKGLREPGFRDLYGTEVLCREALFRWRWPEGFSCPRYLAAFQYRHNRRHRLADMIETLGRDALCTPPTPYWLLKLAEVGA